MDCRLWGGVSISAIQLSLLLGGISSRKAGKRMWFQPSLETTQNISSHIGEDAMMQIWAACCLC